MKIKVGDPEAGNYEVIDLNTNKPIRGVQWADDEIGVYEVLDLNKEGEVKYKLIWKTIGTKRESKYVPIKKRIEGNIKIVKIS